jgi:hypothetical protein
VLKLELVRSLRTKTEEIFLDADNRPGPPAAVECP